MFDQNLYTALCILCYDMLLQTSNFQPSPGKLFVRRLQKHLHHEKKLLQCVFSCTCAQHVTLQLL